ncbi:hypothetical protein ACFL12_02550 [Pseudomonadota bacterium]
MSADAMAKSANAKKKGGLVSKVTGLFGGKSKAAAPSEKPAVDPNAAAAAAAADIPDPDIGKVWPAKRLNVVEKLWGEGYVTPGGADQVKKILPLLALDSKKSLLVLGAGLGGPNETMVEDTGVWITGLERDRELAELGHASMARANLKRQAPVRYSTLEEVELKTKSFDACLSFEGVDAVVDKKALMESVCDSLRIDGELMFSALVLPDTNPPGEKAQAWIAHEPESATPHPWPPQAWQALLGTCNMDVRPFDDITHEYRTWVMNGFMRFLGTVSKEELKEKAQQVVTEVEYWTVRLSAIDAGQIKVARFHAIKLPDQRKSVSELKI